MVDVSGVIPGDWATVDLSLIVPRSIPRAGIHRARGP
jgi:hypothetical protein